jgi:hypothetical protein
MTPQQQGWVWLIVGLLIYFLPTIVTYTRKVHNRTPTFLVNILLGWTFIGWVVALVMASAAQTQYEWRARTPAPVAPTTASDMKTCPQCAERVQSGAKICRFCRYDFGTAPTAPLTTGVGWERGPEA